MRLSSSRKGCCPQVIYMLMNSLGVPQVKALMVAPDGVDAMTAHYAGDEAPHPGNMDQNRDICRGSGFGRGRSVDGIFMDRPPAGG